MFPFGNNNAQNNYNNNNYNYESELAKALRLSEETFQNEEKLRKEAEKLHQKMIQQKREREQRKKQQEQQQQQQKQMQKWSEEKAYSTMMNNMKWNDIFVNRGVGSGIQNLGNSCFMNATLQCLAYTPPFAQLLCQSNHSSQCMYCI